MGRKINILGFLSKLLKYYKICKGFGWKRFLKNLIIFILVIVIYYNKYL